MTLAISADIVTALRIPPDEIEPTLRKELALALYQLHVLPMAKAAVLAQISRWDFEEFLCHRHIDRPYSEEELSEDLKFAREFLKK